MPESRVIDLLEQAKAEILARYPDSHVREFAVNCIADAEHWVSEAEKMLPKVQTSGG